MPRRAPSPANSTKNDGGDENNNTLGTVSTRISHLTVNDHAASVLRGCDDDEKVGEGTEVEHGPDQVSPAISNGAEGGVNGDGKRSRNGHSPRINQHNGVSGFQGSIRSLHRVMQEKISGWREEGDFTLGWIFN